MGHAALEALPKIDAGRAKASIAALFTPGLIADHIARHARLFRPHHHFLFHPEMDAQDRCRHGLCAGIGGGRAGLGQCRRRAGRGIVRAAHLAFGLKPLTLAALLLSSIMVSAFGRGPDDLTQLALMAGAAGFFTEAGIVGLYSVLAQVFPTQLRASGTGFAIGVGRGGAALAPILPALLFQAGYGLQAVAIAMASGSLIAAGALLFLRNASLSQVQTPSSA